ncbi:hypothetical protein IQ270_26620 [Microcoleus sp. LEGE 07076]|uniref:hypothetical protein n=1 Tax=Microcoleus sp. LEGE 07076 TaxID=915322 RepID=UPI0018810E5C|nr:hypothetical protein [Microcoleus sp. LEGE 07076]MBE9188114.1 hypothetical protein [Microcoleus sp. LEGE 07076]
MKKKYFTEWRIWNYSSDPRSDRHSPEGIGKQKVRSSKNYFHTLAGNTTFCLLISTERADPCDFSFNQLQSVNDRAFWGVKNFARGDRVQVDRKI